MIRNLSAAATVLALLSAAPLYAQDAAGTAPGTVAPAGTETPAATAPAATATAPADPAATAPAATAPAATAPAATAEAPATGKLPLAPGMTAQQMHDAARNQLGVLKYCQGKGFATAEAVDAQTRMIGMLPEADASLGDAAEEKGKAGNISAAGVELTLAEGAKRQNSTEEALCQQMDQMMKQLAAAMPPAG